MVEENKLDNMTNEDYKKFLTSLESREYVKKSSPEIRYYIVTYKESESYYRVFLLDNHKKIYAGSANGLDESKYKAIEKLLDIDSSVFLDNKVAMAHYRSDRKNNRPPWERDSPKRLNKTLEDYYKLREGNFNSRSDGIKSKLLGESILKDIEAFEAESDGVEGAKKTYLVNKYERDPKNRMKAIKIHGLNCFACCFNFEEAYGERGKDFIEVHHINPLSTLEEATEVNPETDLVPLCANCHRMVHRRKDNVLSVEALREMIKKLR